MTAHPRTDMEVRVHRLENQNRVSILMLCALAGAGLIAATKQSGSTITAAEVRTQRFTLIDNQGKPLSDTQCVNGVEIRAYLPHEVVQR